MHPLEQAIRDAIRETVLDVLSEHALPSTDPELITMDAAAVLCGCDVSVIQTLERAKDSNGFPAIRLGQRTIRIDKQRLIRWLHAGGKAVKSSEILEPFVDDELAVHGVAFARVRPGIDVRPVGVRERNVVGLVGHRDRDIRGRRVEGIGEFARVCVLVGVGRAGVVDYHGGLAGQTAASGKRQCAGDLERAVRIVQRAGPYGPDVALSDRPVISCRQVLLPHIASEL